MCFIGRAWPNFPSFYSTVQKNTNKNHPQVWALCQKLRNRPRLNILGVHIERVRPHRMKNITALPTLRTFRRKWYQTAGYFLGPFGMVKGQGQCRVSCPLHFRDGSKVEEQTGEKHTKSSRVQNERVCPHPMKNITALPTFGQKYTTVERWLPVCSIWEG